MSVIDTATDAVVKTLHVGGTYHGQPALLGGSPNAVTVSPNGKTLYVANAAQNAVAIVDVDAPAEHPVRGLIPTGWYPTAVALDPTGARLIVASGYGFGSIATTPPGQGRSYTDRVGVVSILDVPDGYRADIFLKEFAEFEKTGNLPNLVLILLYDDHTEGTSPGFPTGERRRQRPRARPDRRRHAESRDLALGERIRHPLQLRTADSPSPAADTVVAQAGRLLAECPR